jgi:hypothetical protein
MPPTPAAHGAPGGTRWPSRALFCRVGPELDARVRRYALAERQSLDRVVESALLAYLATLAPPSCGCIPAVSGDGRQ